MGSLDFMFGLLLEIMLQLTKHHLNPKKGGKTESIVV
jgi:hypothetical protein